MAECVLVYHGKDSLSDENKALLLAKHLLTCNIPKCPSESYHHHILKIAQEAPFCVLDKTSTREQNHQGSIHAAADVVLKAILPKSTFEIIPLIVSLLNGEDVQHPALEKLLNVIPGDEPDSLKLEGTFMLLSNWEGSSLEICNIKIQQKRETTQRFMHQPVTTWKLSGICYYSSFTIILPILVAVMQKEKDAKEWIKNVLKKGFDTNYKAISNSEYLPEMTKSAVIYLEDLQDSKSMLEAKKAVVFVHSWLTHSLPQSPSDRYDYVHKQAKGYGTSLRCTNKDNKSDALTLDDHEGDISVAVDKVLRKVLPKSTHGLIPTIVSLLNHEGDPHPALRKLFTVEIVTSGSKCVEGFFMLLSNWESFTFDVFHIRIQQTQEALRDTPSATISGTCRSSSFMVIPQSISFDSLNNADKEIQKLLKEGLKHGAAIKQCMQSHILSVAGACGTHVDQVESDFIWAHYSP